MTITHQGLLLLGADRVESLLTLQQNARRAHSMQLTGSWDENSAAAADAAAGYRAPAVDVPRDAVAAGSAYCPLQGVRQDEKAAAVT